MCWFLVLMPSIAFSQGRDNPELLTDFNRYQAEGTSYQRPVPLPAMSEPHTRRPIQIAEKQYTWRPEPLPAMAEPRTQRPAQKIAEKQNIQNVTKNDTCACMQEKKTAKLYAAPDPINQVHAFQKSTNTLYNWIWKAGKIAMLILMFFLPVPISIFLRGIFGTASILTA